MDFWLAAAVAGAGYLSKHWQNISRDSKSSAQFFSGDSGIDKPDSPRCPLRGTTQRTVVDNEVEEVSSLDEASRVRDSENYRDLGEMMVLNLQSGFSGSNEAEGECGSMNELLPDNGHKRKRNSVRTKRSRAYSVKPTNALESCLMAQMYKEQDQMEDCVVNSHPLLHTATVRSLLVTDGGSCVISGSRRKLFAAQTRIEEGRFRAEVETGGNVFRVPPLKAIEYVDSTTAVEAKAQKEKNGKAFNPHEGSPNGAFLLCLGISIGIMSSFVTSKTEVDKLKETLKQSENLVQDLQEELEMKDSLTVKELANDNYESRDISDNSISEMPCGLFFGELNIDSYTRHEDRGSCVMKAEESSECISKIEAELEAELEILGLNMNASTLERRLPDVTELDPDSIVDFAQGELKLDMLRVEDVSKSKSNEDEASTSTKHDATGNHGVSPRELTLRLHEVIQSRLEERINELEIALENAHRKMQLMQSGIKTRESPITKEHKSPLAMHNSSYNDAREEAMKMSDDSEEENSPQRIYEDIHCSQASLHGVFQSQDDKTFGYEIPEEKSLGHISLVLGSNDTSNSRDEISDCDDNEVERELIKRIVERTKKGSGVVMNAQRLLFSLDEK